MLALAKIVACSLTIGIGGSGGVFAPSLFVGVTSGMTFGDVVHHLFGAAAGQPALYAVVAMGAVFTSAARAPLTSLASVVEMTGDFTLTLPVMLAVAIASTVSRSLSYGTIYTTKLLRRGTDIDRSTPWRALQDLKVADAIQPFQPPFTLTRAHGFGLTAKGPLIVSEAFGGSGGGFLICGVWRWRAHDGERRADGVYAQMVCTCGTGLFSQSFRCQYRAAVAAVSGSREPGSCCRTCCRSA